jgi:signal transduction histidine kinase
MSRARAFLASMTGRLFVILAIGMCAAGWLASVITNARSDREFKEQLVERAADRLEGYVTVLDAVPAPLRNSLSSSSGIIGIRAQPPSTAGGAHDAEFERALSSRSGIVAVARAQRADLALCFPETSEQELQSAFASDSMHRALRGPIHMRLKASNWSNFVPPMCRLITLRLSDGTQLHVSLDTPWVGREPNRLLDPIFLMFLTLALGALAYVIARIASAPLKQLSNAATDLGQDLERAPLSVSGPTEVRRAAEAFNAMQQRLRQHLSERTHMLAAITHDLQTPLTRLRLRLERVQDEALRARLVADFGSMKALINEGLELARSTETSEPRVPLDLDSLLESLVEDAVDAGADAAFERGSHAVIHLRPVAVRRLFSNLIDNALKYGGSAYVSAERSDNDITVRVRDHGPGMGPEMLERVFEPFFRLEHSRSRETGGVGLGLTIARTLASKNGATLSLRNHPEGGLEAVVCWSNVIAGYPSTKAPP